VELEHELFGLSCPSGGNLGPIGEDGTESETSILGDSCDLTGFSETLSIEVPIDVVLLGNLVAVFAENTPKPSSGGTRLVLKLALRASVKPPSSIGLKSVPKSPVNVFCLWIAFVV